MLQASQFHGPLLDPFSLQQDGLAAPEVDVGGCEIVEALVIAAMIISLDEGSDLRFEIAWQEVVLQEDAVLERLVPTLDLALGLRMQWRPADMIHAVVFEPVCEIFGNVARAIVAQQPGAVNDIHAVEA